MKSDESTVGAAPPPPGIKPNLENPESIAHRVIIISVIGAVITIPICLLRLYTKRYILRNIGWDDYFIVLATLLALGFSILTGYPGPIFYNLSTLFTKLSLGLFYLRLSPFRRGLRLAVYAVLLSSSVNGVLAAFGFAWVCQPIAKYWDFSITTGKCINLNAYFLATACINAATDLALLIIPIFIMQHLQLASRRKIGAALLLMTGSFVCVVSLIRVEIVVKGMGLIPTDGTWGMVANFIWLLLEMWLGIICTCLPMLYTFTRTQVLGKRGAGREAAFPAVRDPNSGQPGHGAPAVFSDSGYDSGQLSNFTLDQRNGEGTAQKDGHGHDERLAASDKSLLIKSSNCSA